MPLSPELTDWDIPDPGTGQSTPRRLRCLDCAFTGEFTAAVAHWRETDHRLTYKEAVQDFRQLGKGQRKGAAA